VLPSDPAVFFGGINYLWNIKDKVNRFIVPQTQVPNTDPPEFEGGVFIGEVDPGDSLGLNFGMGVALNERSSFSVGYEHTWVNKTEIDGETAMNSLAAQLGTLQVGYSYRLNKQSSLNLSIGAGVTEDAPDATISLRLPYRF
jgi:opacity protein-like surface antigen